MADRKITDLTALAAGSQATGDLLTIVDVSEGAAADKNKKITVESLFKGVPGTVGIGTSSPATRLDVQSSAATAVRINSSSSSHFGQLQLQTSSQFIIGYAGSHGSQPNQLSLKNNVGDISFFTNSNERLRIDSSGNVGIGTTSITEKLTVFSNNDSSAVDNGLAVYRSAGDDKVNINCQGGAARFISDGGSSYIPTRFGRYDGTTLATDVTIDTAGNLGIGTTSPSQSWTGGSSRTQQLSGLSGQITVLRVNEAGGTGGDLQLVSSTSAEAAVYNFANGPLRFGTNSAERMRIDTGGNLGLGTTSPSTRLEVVGNTTPQLKVGMANDADRASLMHNGSDLYLGTTAGSLIFRTASNTERMRIQSAGGISFNGDTAAANALDDYEEGTWSPQFANQAKSTANISSQPAGMHGSYTKIGNRVFFNCWINGSMTTTETTNRVRVINLPFPAASSGDAYSALSFWNYGGFSTYRDEVVVRNQNGDDTIIFQRYGADLTFNDIVKSGINMMVSGHYRV